MSWHTSMCLSLNRHQPRKVQDFPAALNDSAKALTAPVLPVMPYEFSPAFGLPTDSVAGLARNRLPSSTRPFSPSSATEHCNG